MKDLSLHSVLDNLMILLEMDLLDQLYFRGITIHSSEVIARQGFCQAIQKSIFI